MERLDDSLWTIDDLGAKVADALAAAGYSGVANGRVRDVPDQRTIRYYSTLGLIDRPSGARGRVALYGPRHLRQLVAIKSLQSRGKTLAEVQQDVAGASDSMLAMLAGSSKDTAPASDPGSKRPRKSRSETFWRESPTAPLSSVESVPIRASLQATRVGPSVTLLLECVRPIDDDDLNVIRMAAAPLIELLRLRGLIGPNGSDRFVSGVAHSPLASPVPARDDRGSHPEKEAP